MTCHSCGATPARLRGPYGELCRSCWESTLAIVRRMLAKAADWDPWPEVEVHYFGPGCRTIPWTAPSGAAGRETLVLCGAVVRTRGELASDPAAVTCEACRTWISPVQKLD